MNIQYKKGTAEEQDIYTHLIECNYNFKPLLETRINIQEYSKKIHDNATTFEAWDGKHLVGLLAAYFNDTKNHFGYITSVSVVKDHFGQGIASKLMKDCMDHAEANRFREISLEVFHDNSGAIHMYRKYNFEVTSRNGEKLIMTYKPNSL